LRGPNREAVWPYGVSLRETPGNTTVMPFLSFRFLLCKNLENTYSRPPCRQADLYFQFVNNRIKLVYNLSKKFHFLPLSICLIKDKEKKQRKKTWKRF
jgi:hypothetical protein